MTIRERREMRRMGYTVKAWYISPRGIPFHKDFITVEEMEAFNKAAAEAGTRLKGFERI